MAALMLGGCSGETETAITPDMGMTAPTVDQGRPTPRPSNWTTGVVETGGTGKQPSLAVSPSGTVAVAYFNSSGVRGELCTEINDGPDVPEKVNWTIRYAEMVGMTWTAQTAHEPLLLGEPVGLSLRFSPEGTPHLATMTGEPVEMLVYCGANDVGLLTPGDDTWDLETVVAESNEAPTGMPGSDFGSVVGYWSGLAFDSDGQPAIAYRDVHGGGLQGDDLTRADLEFAWKRGGSWTKTAVDIGEGAGDYNQVIFDAEGRPLILYANPVEQTLADKIGLWIARSSDNGETWEKFRLLEGKTSERPSMVTDPSTGDIHIAFSDPSLGKAVVATLLAGADFGAWTTQLLGDNRYIEGEHPSLAIDQSGHLTIAWYRCGRAGISTTCDPQYDAAVFGWFVDDEWVYEVIDDGEEGLCGRYPNMVYNGENRAVVVYQCAKRQGDDFEFELRFARRSELR
jgi:hypothetical protein